MSEEVGRKDDSKKLDWTLLPFDSLSEVVRVMEFGAEKYSRDNWKKVVPNVRYLKAAFRHLIKYAGGEKLDSESGLNHLAHCVCCLLFLIWGDNNDSRN